jgi:PAS domain S-box-containing protein
MKSETLDEKAPRDEKSRTLEALRISEERNRDLVENSAYGIFRVSADGSFLDGNPALLRITGCASAEDLLALNLARDIFRFPEKYTQLSSACRENGRVHGAGRHAAGRPAGDRDGDGGAG